jgi:hypothetical protein
MPVTGVGDQHATSLALTSWVFGLYDSVMTTPLSLPCDRCGQPVVEAHYPDGRCPRPRRRAARKAVAVIGTIAAVIVMVVAALMFFLAAAGGSPSHHQHPRKNFASCCASY